MDLTRFPRRRYTHGVTPLEFLPRFTRLLGGPKIWIKRDDLLGLSPGGGSNALGGLGYVACAQELQQQLLDQAVHIDRVVVASGSTGTHGGLLAGFPRQPHWNPNHRHRRYAMTRRQSPAAESPSATTASPARKRSLVTIHHQT
jgi:1-aminocyclopropane-1-carboxylate deaminase/D-cysteine desulfhydrase-like pyridoxal-dependent ACC family enzyme